MNQFYFKARIHRDDEMYACYGIRIDADEMVEASRLFAHWAEGVLITADCVGIDRVDVSCKPGGIYYQPNDPFLKKSIRDFINDVGENSDQSNED